MHASVLKEVHSMGPLMGPIFGFVFEEMKRKNKERGWDGMSEEKIKTWKNKEKVRGLSGEKGRRRRGEL